MKKKRNKVNLDADIKKAEKSTKSKTKKQKEGLDALMDMVPKEVMVHFQNSHKELLLGAKTALNGMMDSLIEGSEKSLK